MELSPGDKLVLGRAGAKCITQHRSKYFSIKEKNGCLAYFFLKPNWTWSSRLFLLSPLPMLRFQTVPVICRWKAEMLWEVTHPQPDCDTATEKHCGIRAICLSSEGLTPKIAYPHLQLFSHRLTLRAAPCTWMALLPLFFQHNPSGKCSVTWNI